MNSQNKNSRRSFLSSAARLLGLTGMGLFAAASAQKRASRRREGKCEDPQGRTGCGACRLYSRCGLPRVLSFRQSGRG